MCKYLSSFIWFFTHCVKSVSYNKHINEETYTQDYITCNHKVLQKIVQADRSGMDFNSYKKVGLVWLICRLGLTPARIWQKIHQSVTDHPTLATGSADIGNIADTMVTCKMKKGAICTMLLLLAALACCLTVILTGWLNDGDIEVITSTTVQIFLIVIISAAIIVMLSVFIASKSSCKNCWLNLKSVKHVKVVSFSYFRRWLFTFSVDDDDAS